MIHVATPPTSIRLGRLATTLPPPPLFSMICKAKLVGGAVPVALTIVSFTRSLTVKFIASFCAQ